MKKAVSIKDIAEALDLSRNTVSKALNGQHVPQKTKELVLKKAKELNYKSLNENISNSGNYRILLFSGKSYTNISFFVPLVRRVEDYCYKNNYAFMQYTYRDVNVPFSKIADYIKKLDVDGVLAIECFESVLIQNLLSLDIPICFIDFLGQNIITDKTYDVVSSSNQKSVHLYIASLINDKGFKRFSFVGDFRHCYSFHERYIGMIRAIERAGLPHSTNEDILESDDDFKYGNITALKNRIRELKRMPECFVCCNDFVARRVIIALKELGYSVPDDTTVVGYDGGREATDESPTITTFYQDKEFLGEIAVRLLIARIEMDKSPNKILMIDTKLIVGESTEKHH